MTFQAQKKKAAAWLDALTTAQAEETAHPQEQLIGDALALSSDGALIAITQPAPVAGYAAVGHSGGVFVATVHVLDKTPVEGYRALFSQMWVQAERRGAQEVIVDVVTTSQRVQAAVREHGAQFGVRVADPAPIALIAEPADDDPEQPARLETPTEPKRRGRPRKTQTEWVTDGEA